MNVTTPVLEVHEQKVPASDRRLAWWTVLLAMAMAVLAAASSVLFAIHGLEERERFEHQVDELETSLAAAQGANQCRAEAYTDLQNAINAAQGFGLDVLIETADQFNKVLRRQETAPFRLQQRVQWARDALDDARGAVITYQLTVEECD